MHPDTCTLICDGVTGLGGVGITSKYLILKKREASNFDPADVPRSVTVNAGVRVCYSYHVYTSTSSRFLSVRADSSSY